MTADYYAGERVRDENPIRLHIWERRNINITMRINHPDGYKGKIDI